MKLLKFLLVLFGFFAEIHCQRATIGCNQRNKNKRNILLTPNQLPTSCSYTFDAYNNKVCQLLIEFQKFELDQPKAQDDAELECQDSLVVGGFKICGYNSQQHIYVPLNVAGGERSITLAFNLTNRWPFTSWHLIVTQLECPTTTTTTTGSLRTFPFLVQATNAFGSSRNDAQMLAPNGCHQFFRQTTGTIRSFNYFEGANNRHLPNMNYVICVKGLNGPSKIEYNVETFSLSTNINGLGFDYDCHSFVNTPGRRQDYLMIPQSTVSNYPDFQPTFYCGTALSSRSQITANAPLVMYFVTDDISDSGETGFKFTYQVKTAF